MIKENLFIIKKVNRKFIYVIYLFLYISLIIDIEIKEKFIISDELYKTYLNIIIILIPIIALFYKANFFKEYLDQKIELKEKELIIPKDFGKLKYKEYLYKDIISIDKRGKKANTFICIQTKDKVYHLYKNLFINQKHFSKFYYSLLYKIKKNGSYNKVKKQRQISKNIFNKLQYGSIFLLILLIIAFSIQEVSKSLYIHYLILSGAANKDLILNGDYFRLISSFFLHANYPHFIFNILIFFPFFYLLEGLIGFLKAYLILFIGHIIGLSLSLIFNEHIILGASAGIFSLIGAYFYICLKYKHFLPAGLYLPIKKWLLFLAFNVFLFFTLKNISFSAHIFGFLTGLILMFIFSYKNNFLELRKKNKVFIKLSFIALLAIQASLLFSYNIYLQNEDYKEKTNLKVLEKLINDDNNKKINDLNKFAWDIAIDENANYQLQLIGKLAVEKAFKHKDLSNDIQNALKDTLASIHFRLGNNSDALIMENNLFMNAEKLNDKEFYASQIIRFASFTNKTIGILDGKIFFINKNFISNLKNAKNDCILYQFNDPKEVVVNYIKQCNSDLINLEANQIIFLKYQENQKNSQQIYKFDRRVNFFPFYK